MQHDTLQISYKFKYKLFYSYCGFGIVHSPTMPIFIPREGPKFNIHGLDSIFQLSILESFEYWELGDDAALTNELVAMVLLLVRANSCVQDM